MAEESFCHPLSTWSAKLINADLCPFFGLLLAFLLGGCAGTKMIILDSPNSLNLSGLVQGGQQPIAGAELRLYATGSTGDGSTSTVLLSQPFQSGSNGEFTISGSYTCQSAASQVYLVATGGNPGLSSGSSNSSIGLMAALGPCGNLSGVSYTTVNEVTTVGSIWPLAAYAKSVAQIGSGSADVQTFDAAAGIVSQLISVANGTAPGPMLASGNVAPTAKLYSLASIIAACVNSSGGSAGDGSACGQLFSSAASAGVPPPSDTIAAALAIAQNPTRNVVGIFDLTPINGAFQPVLSSPPTDWTLPILSVPAAPTISPDSGTILSGQTVSIAENTQGAVVYYTMDGSSPSAASPTYLGPIALTNSGTISAVAIKDSLRSSTVSQLFTVLNPVGVTLAPGSVTLTSSQTQAFRASVASSSNSAVTWSLTPAMGSISAAGLYTAPAVITALQTVTVAATSVADSTKKANANVLLSPPVSVAVTPGSVTLTSSQTQAFTASVANSSNSAVTWSLSPAVGSISAAGLYTAPATITAPQTVTVTATSVADSTKRANANVLLSPPVGVAVTPGSVTLTSSQTQAFAASVANSSNTAVTWSLSPAVGSISAAGLYTAPATITAPQTVTVTAISVADPSKKASASALLSPTVGVAVTPGSVTLTSSQTQAFTASVANSSNSAVTWSLSPAVGSISAAGLYTAPATITAPQTVTVTATSMVNSASSASARVSLAVPTLSINATSLPFGNVVVNTAAILPLTLTSTGTAPVTINAATLTGQGFSVSGATFPVTLNPGQAVTLSVQFDPIAIGMAAGQLTISSNSSTGGTAAISLSGTGQPHQVDLSWDAPAGSADPIAGYNVYRSPGGASTYQLLNPSVDTLTTYVDSTVQSGFAYDYIVESVDASGVESAPSNVIGVTIP
jgi:trimeric autotransporter adhesin